MNGETIVIRLLRKGSERLDVADTASTPSSSPS